MDKKDTNAIERIEMAIQNLKNNDFTLYFFVLDCKNVPNGSLQYIYQLAKTLQDKGYNVKMLYQMPEEYDKDELDELERKEKPIDDNRKFIGVSEWLGHEYDTLEHFNISKNEWHVTPSDFLFIPEALSSLMKQTYQYKAPCKRIVVLHNFDYVTDFIPFNDEWGTYGIHDAIAETKYQGKLITGVFPYVTVKTLSPYVDECFRKPIAPKKLIVNIVSKRTDDVNKIMKQFYWKYPLYKFISFRDLRGYPKDKFAEYLQETAITIWMDTETPFGYSAIEAMRCGNIVIGKIPEHLPEWMGDENGLFDNGVWTYDINLIPDILSNVIGSWMRNKMPSIIFDNMAKLDTQYTRETWETNVEDVIKGYVNDRIKEFTEIKNVITNKK